jgi:hypothetical protein
VTPKRDTNPESRRLQVAAAAAIGAGVMMMIAIWAFPPQTPSGKPKIVTLDAVRLVNAERAAISGMLGANASRGDIALRMLHIGRSVKATVRKVAGAGTIVVVKQAIVAGSVPDITTKVLKDLGLPLHAPTINLAKYINQAPTMLDLAQYGISLRHRNARLLTDARKAAAKQTKERGRKAAENILP